MDEIRLATYEAFVAFLFDETFRGPSGEPIRESYGAHWYDDIEVGLDAAICARYYIRLFESPAQLIDMYPHSVLEYAFGAMINCNYPLSVSELVWDSDVPLETREELIRSMVPLFERFFAVKPFWYSTYMWWDAIAFAYCCGNAVRGRSEEETRLQDVIFASLQKILVIPSDECRDAALHGLGHLMHPDTESLIERFLAEHPELNPDTRAYALAAASGDVQ